ncbi:MAG: carboxymuconolactone decarboxylase family protein [Acidimicrobiales bacterium]|nr:carboxymuconolactone decarboxylase family protein [Acidimicrobiales bacterium]
MPLVELIDHRSAPLLLRELFGGDDPGPIVGALAQVPELCLVTLPFVGAALGPSHVPLRWKEIAILRTSALLGCRYCVDAHTVVALDAGLAAEEVATLRCERPDTATFTDPVERALVAWIDEVATGRGPVPDHVGAELRRHLDDHTIVELTVTVGATLLLNRFATALCLPSSPATLQRLAAEGFR